MQNNTFIFDLWTHGIAIHMTTCTTLVTAASYLIKSVYQEGRVLPSGSTHEKPGSTHGTR